jgi:hypothetical protein
MFRFHQSMVQVPIRIRFHERNAVFYDRARKFRRSSSGSPLGISCSISRCVRSHIGIAARSKVCPSAVSVKIRLRRSEGSCDIFTKPRFSSGFNAAVNVVRSIASREATGPMDGGSGRLRDINNENCPFVRPNGRNASSNRRARERAARCT